MDVCIYSRPVPGAIEPHQIRSGLGASPYFRHTQSSSTPPPDTHTHTNRPEREDKFPCYPFSLLIWTQERT